MNLRHRPFALAVVLAFAACDREPTDAAPAARDAMQDASDGAPPQEVSADVPAADARAVERAFDAGDSTRDLMDARGDDPIRADGRVAVAVEASSEGSELGEATVPAIDEEGCPMGLEGFASVHTEGQRGTTGGAAGTTVTVGTQAELMQYASAAEPYVIRVRGAVMMSPKGTEIRVASHKTIVGVGKSGEIVGGGFILGAGVHNVILRNLTIRDAFVEGDWEGKTQDYDGVQMDSAHHVWIDHCHLHHMGDGLIDSRKDTTFLTVSWNILSDHNKVFGIGWTENVTAQVTMHHNWLRDVHQRNPSADNVLRAHLYNNWLERVGSYGNYARGGTNMVLENSVFEGVPRPHYYDTGTLVAIGNEYVGTDGEREASGSHYDFFDPREHYRYELTPTRDVPRLLAACAGPRLTLGR